ncbi:MAG: FAD-dependent oxidoreductase [Chloroflexota bacterium]|nr:FAD-dependent oxidoreductase [Chloroflexota bacterium]
MPAGHERPPVVIIGAGVAGLVAAVALHEAGIPVRVFEAADDVGGRMRTDRHAEGFLLDRGYQVLLDAYPAAQRWIDHDALELGRFDAGALLWTGRRLAPLANPLRHPAALPRDLTFRVFSMADKVRLARLGAETACAPWQSANQAATSLGNDMPAVEYLWSRGFSEAFVDRFARPFWGGITLDPHLAGSSGPLLFTMKMFLRGSAALPKAGIGAMPFQLLARLPEGTVSLSSRVTSIVVADGRLTGVRVARKKIPAAAVIVATDPVAAEQLTGVRALANAAAGVPSVTVFLAGERDPGTGPRIVLDATRRLLVNEIAPLSAAQPSYAPPGRHLIAAVIVGDAARNADLEDIGQRARDDVATMLGHDPSDWRVLETVAVPFSQFAQPPGIYRRLPGNVAHPPGLFLASEATVDSSYNGAMLSGDNAAGIVRRELAFAASAPRVERDAAG